MGCSDPSVNGSRLGGLGVVAKLELAVALEGVDHAEDGVPAQSVTETGRGTAWKAYKAVEPSAFTLPVDSAVLVSKYPPAAS